MELCLLRDSDKSGDEESDHEGSEMSSASETEAMLLHGGDITIDKQSSDVDSDQDWEPDTSRPVSKRPHRVEQQDSTSSGEEPHPPTPQRGSASSRRPRGSAPGRRGRGTGSSSQDGTSGQRWNDVGIPDITPPQPTFGPARSSGPQLTRTATYTALQLFQLYFTNSVLQTIIENTNDFGSTHYSLPSNLWIDVTLQDMFSFMSLIVYMGVLKCSGFTDYWRGGKLYSLPFPRRVMTGKKFLRISQALHLSSSVEDAANEQRRGTAAFDRLCKIKPLYEEIREACKRNYHPSQEIAIDERMVAPKACIGLKEHMKNKPVRWGYKLFALADCSSGYTIRWIRKDSLLFVQWRDKKDVFMCSTLHTAHAEDTVQRRVKGADGHCASKDIPVPPAVKEYNQSMGRVDLSDALIGSYKVLHKTQTWYKTFFYHFMDIAIVNAFLLHTDIAEGEGEAPMHQKAFRETLAKELAEVGSPSTARPGPPPAPSGAHHRPVHISGRSTAGRLKCRHCHAKTPVKCSSCDVPLCLVPGRDCYNNWHVANNL
ncbi:hypothetical protein VZT92_009592 [Zoarces viviparus]|uniref:PiggyBac transposable element-derived protein domain-containing protein n=1 Tax=Zoarces viviparus TaxID=48416 RepID=A0AAW1FF37_ZOAVI